MADRPITREEKRLCVARELRMRKRVYPRWVADGRMTQAEAEREIATMGAILRDYEQPDLFGAKA
jgi:hypothetical protein